MKPEEMEAARWKAHEHIWRDMTWVDWSSWERRFWDLRERAIPYDEVTYTLLLHGYLLSHRHAAENAYHVLEEMRRAEVHPAILRLNHRLLDAAFELRELGHRPEASMWRNVTRLCWHCAMRFQKKRRERLKHELQELEPDEALALGPGDARRWLRGHDRLALPPPARGSGPARFLELSAGEAYGKAARLLSAPRPAGVPGRSGRRSRRAAAAAAA